MEIKEDGETETMTVAVVKKFGLRMSLAFYIKTS